MYRQSFSIGGHKWIKTNLITKKDGKGFFDEYKCECCGIVGKSYSLGTIEIKDYYRHRAENCPYKTKHTRVKITNCNATGKVFSNLVPNSIHEIITPPNGKTNERGEWVMGVGEPVLVLNEEFEYID